MAMEFTFGALIALMNSNTIRETPQVIESCYLATETAL